MTPLHATRAAVEEGIVAGGGVAYHPRNCFSGRPERQLTKTKQLVSTSSALALEAPLRTIVSNAGQRAICSCNATK